MIYKLAGEAFPDIKIHELTAFYEELEKWSDIFEGVRSGAGSSVRVDL